ncbi:LytTR family DNA-binding domain-containing protein [Enterovibrio sp. ZSDZ35]|uniref:LytTR family DNA-binding domain-containing protein n=1 Tax=Enterovibrio qingdaonensis TaxID=2899818 RepID=A0ABT5QHW9_9GAMM|nr:LytTR family DNA-binding domain-containing protein [Enterovibrio sp. ZSDZ35]MDD1780075.1 LytTR family DNA-binding domain-containing protein [Enterovibrio sp. ZSDZ35]
MRIIIADDEPLLRHHLGKLLEDISPELHIVASVGDGTQALEKIQSLQPDVVFLDIRMPGLDGLQVASALNKQNIQTNIVFVTAYDDHAIEAFEEGAIDYLVKPIDETRLLKTTKRLQSAQHRSTPNDDLLDLIRQTQSPQFDSLTWLRVAKGEDIHLIHVDEVVLFKAEDKYVTVVTDDAEYIIRTPLRLLAQQLCGNTFWQIHRSVIVRVSAISRVSKDDMGKMFVETVAGNTRLPVSRSAHSLFKQM